MKTYTRLADIRRSKLETRVFRITTRFYTVTSVTKDIKMDALLLTDLRRRRGEEEEVQGVH